VWRDAGYALLQSAGVFHHPVAANDESADGQQRQQRVKILPKQIAHGAAIMSQNYLV
jgi:hypothetical protein